MGFTTSTSTRQTVLSGGTDSNGYANFLSAGSGLAVNLDTNLNPVILSIASGFNEYGTVDYIEKIDTDQVISGLTANQTNFIYAERNTATGAISFNSTTLVPIYAYKKPSSPNTGQFCFVIPEMKMYYYNGSSWDEKQVVFIGEAVTSASSVTNTITYALRGEYLTDYFAVNQNSTYQKSHNIGVNLDLCNSNYFFTINSDGSQATPSTDYFWADSNGYMYSTSIENTTYVTRLKTYLGYLGGAVGLYKGSGQSTGYLRIYIKRNF